jgi:hypothetical protein
MGDRRGAYRGLVKESEGKKPFGSPRCRWERNFKMNLQEVRGGGTDYIDLAQDRDKRQALVKAEINLWVP